MDALIQSAPLIISDRIENEMAMSITELCAVQAIDTRPAKNGPPCQVVVKIGLFFDGSNNNKERDEPLNGHTNIVKLFNAHKDVNEKGVLKVPYHYKFYVPGVGTRFPENAEWRELQGGKAFGDGSKARILFGLLQVYNAVYRTFNEGNKMLDLEEITTKLKQYGADKDPNDPLADRYDSRPDRHSWLAELTEELRAARKSRWSPGIDHIRISVFGFSRGAVIARAFCYWFNDVLDADGTFAGMRVSIDFLGLFDSVASIGLPNSAKETIPVVWSDGHKDWAGEVLKPLPDCVRQTVHYIAAHEQRRSFPLTRVKGKNVSEVIYPGVHSDVGGAYKPGDQGRGIWNGKGEMGMLASQIPLAHMHRAASKAGVPLAAYCVMDERLKKDYIISPKLALAWNDYMAAGKAEFVGVPGDKIERNYHSIVRKHMALYYAFRRLRLSGLEESFGYSRANPQDQEDLQSYNDLLRGDVAVLKERAHLARTSVSRDTAVRAFVRFSDMVDGSANAWQLRLAIQGSPPGPDELWALEEMTKVAVSQKTPFLVLLEGYLHDSLASFSIAGYGSDEDKAEALLEMATAYDKTGKSPSTSYNGRVWRNYQRAIAVSPELSDILQSRIDTMKQADKAPGYRADQIRVMESAKKQTVFAPDEQAALAKFFPIQTDADAPELRSVFIRTQTKTRREGSGYLRQRHVFE
ncbi:T6SS phospholipase effector Tle1-like catalytic domain-containing protein [Glaciimonas sp. GNP009]